MSESKNLYQRLLAVASEMDSVIKDTEVRFGGSKYKGISHDAVVTAVRESMIKHGVVALPSVIEYENSEVETKNGDPAYMTNVKVRTTFINADKPEETVCVDTIGSGIDSQDKAPGKAMSYAKKYGFLYCFLLITADGDETRPDEEAYRGRSNGSRQKPAGKPAQSRPAVEPATEEQLSRVMDLAREVDQEARDKALKYMADHKNNGTKIDQLIGRLEEKVLA